MELLPKVINGKIVEEKEKPLKKTKKRKQKKQKLKRVKVIKKGEKCPCCNNPMQRRTHASIGEKQLKKAYYYKEWDYCSPCRYVQHYEKFKVFNNNEKGRSLQMKQELDVLDHFMRHL